MKLNKYIDHTCLKATATIIDIKKLCDEAKQYKFKAVCINPSYVNLASQLLKDTDVKVCTVIGFPLGANTTSVKKFEAIDAIKNGADEIDMVINIGALKNKDYNYVEKEIKEIKEAILDKTLKVIVETCYLTKEEIIQMTEICNKTGANFIKTSTGFGTRGANIEDIEIMKEHCNDSLKIKASGGIKDYNKANQMIKLGVTRLGTSSGVNIIENNKEI